MTDFLNGLGYGVVVFAILFDIAALALLFGLLDRWIVFADPKPRGWRYWPWAFRFYREHGSWPL